MLEEKDPFLWAKKIFHNLTDELTVPEKSELKDSLEKDPEIRKIMDELEDSSSVHANLKEFRSYDAERAYHEASSSRQPWLQPPSPRSCSGAACIAGRGV